MGGLARPVDQARDLISGPKARLEGPNSPLNVIKIMKTYFLFLKLIKYYPFLKRIKMIFLIKKSFFTPGRAWAYPFEVGASDLALKTGI